LYVIVIAITSMAFQHISLFFIVCFIIIHKAEAQSQTNYCQAVGDPHITGFTIAGVQWCIQNGSQVLLQNSFLQLSIHVTQPPGGYFPIDSVTLDFHPTGGSWCVITSACLVASGTTAACCPASTGDIAITTTVGGWVITYTSLLIVNIYSYGGGATFDVQITQATSELPYSSGLCVCGCPAAYINPVTYQTNPLDQAPFNAWQQQQTLKPTQTGLANYHTIFAQDAQTVPRTPTLYAHSAIITLDFDLMQQQTLTIKSALPIVLRNANRKPSRR